jgi:hypothetical protein
MSGAWLPAGRALAACGQSIDQSIDPAARSAAADAGAASQFPQLLSKLRAAHTAAPARAASAQGLGRGAAAQNGKRDPARAPAADGEDRSSALEQARSVGVDRAVIAAGVPSALTGAVAVGTGIGGPTPSASSGGDNGRLPAPPAV